MFVHQLGGRIPHDCNARDRRSQHLEETLLFTTNQPTIVSTSKPTSASSMLTAPSGMRILGCGPTGDKIGVSSVGGLDLPFTWKLDLCNLVGPLCKIPMTLGTAEIGNVISHFMSPTLCLHVQDKLNRLTKRLGMSERLEGHSRFRTTEKIRLAGLLYAREVLRKGTYASYTLGSWNVSTLSLPSELSADVLHSRTGYRMGDAPVLALGFL
jgi:hypothetical protein